METKHGKNQNAILKGYNMLLYFAGSMIMYEPVEECITDFWSNGMLSTLPVSSTNPRFVKAASQLRGSCGDPEVCINRLQEDYKKLFTGRDFPDALPLKSHFITSHSSNGRESEKVSDFYNSYGWKNRSRYNIPDDHLGIELLFLTILNDKFISIDDDACRKEMGNEIRRFIEHHILSWLPEWNNLVQQNSETLSYKGIATLIYASCEDIFALLGGQDGNLDFMLGSKN